MLQASLRVHVDVMPAPRINGRNYQLVALSGFGVDLFAVYQGVGKSLRPGRSFVIIRKGVGRSEVIDESLPRFALPIA
jgi:hypothetical protein